MFVKNDKCSNIESKYINLQDAGSCCLSLESIKIYRFLLKKRKIAKNRKSLKVIWSNCVN